MTTKAKRGETTKRIYSILRKTPGLTTIELQRELPDLTLNAISSTITAMRRRGEIEQLGVRFVSREGVNGKTCRTYHVKYKPKMPSVPKVRTPKVKAEPKPEAQSVEQLQRRNDMLLHAANELAFDLAEARIVISKLEAKHDCWWCRLKKAFS